MGGGGKGGQDNGYQAPATPDPGPSAEELAAEERARQEENAAQIEARRKEAAAMGEQSTLGNSEDLKKKKPTLLGGTQSNAINTATTTNTQQQ